MQPIVDIGSRVDAMISSHGYRVDQIKVQKHLSRPPKTMPRVCRGTYLVADCRTVEEVARLVTWRR